MSLSTNINVMANVLDTIQESPQAQQKMLGIGMAYDVMRHVPVDMLSSTPHYETEVDSGNTRPAVQPG